MVHCYTNQMIWDLRSQSLEIFARTNWKNGKSLIIVLTLCLHGYISFFSSIKLDTSAAVDSTVFAMLNKHTVIYQLSNLETAIMATQLAVKQCCVFARAEWIETATVSVCSCVLWWNETSDLSMELNGFYCRLLLTQGGDVYTSWLWRHLICLMSVYFIFPWWMWISYWK